MAPRIPVAVRQARADALVAEDDERLLEDMHQKVWGLPESRPGETGSREQPRRNRATRQYTRKDLYTLTQKTIDEFQITGRPALEAISSHYRHRSAISASAGPPAEHSAALSEDEDTRPNLPVLYYRDLLGLVVSALRQEEEERQRRKALRKSEKRAAVSGGITIPFEQNSLARDASAFSVVPENKVPAAASSSDVVAHHTTPSATNSSVPIATPPPAAESNDRTTKSGTRTPQQSPPAQHEVAPGSSTTTGLPLQPPEPPQPESSSPPRQSDNMTSPASVWQSPVPPAVSRGTGGSAQKFFPEQFSGPRAGAAPSNANKLRVVQPVQEQLRASLSTASLTSPSLLQQPVLQLGYGFKARVEEVPKKIPEERAVRGGSRVAEAKTTVKVESEVQTSTALSDVERETLKDFEALKKTLGKEAEARLGGVVQRPSWDVVRGGFSGPDSSGPLIPALSVGSEMQLSPVKKPPEAQESAHDLRRALEDATRQNAQLQNRITELEQASSESKSYAVADPVPVGYAEANKEELAKMLIEALQKEVARLYVARAPSPETDSRKTSTEGNAGPTPAEPRPDALLQQSIWQGGSADDGGTLHEQVKAVNRLRDAWQADVAALKQKHADEMQRMRRAVEERDSEIFRLQTALRAHENRPPMSAAQNEGRPVGSTMEQDGVEEILHMRDDAASANASVAEVETVNAALDANVEALSRKVAELQTETYQFNQMLLRRNPVVQSAPTEPQTAGWVATSPGLQPKNAGTKSRLQPLPRVEITGRGSLIHYYYPEQTNATGEDPHPVLLTEHGYSPNKDEEADKERGEGDFAGTNCTTDEVLGKLDDFRQLMEPMLQRCGQRHQAVDAEAPEVTCKTSADANRKLSRTSEVVRGDALESCTATPRPGASVSQEGGGRDLNYPLSSGLPNLGNAALFKVDKWGWQSCDAPEISSPSKISSQLRVSGAPPEPQLHKVFGGKAPNRSRRHWRAGASNGTSVALPDTFLSRLQEDPEPMARIDKRTPSVCDVMGSVVIEKNADRAREEKEEKKSATRGPGDGSWTGNEKLSGGQQEGEMSPTRAEQWQQERWKYMHSVGKEKDVHLVSSEREESVLPKEVASLKEQMKVQNDRLADALRRVRERQKGKMIAGRDNVIR
ncbi:unnamed protein product [Amoebophrya sp. A120]|nr:unnamed protein product [Amoebophrya sp. A120]|eukprot:GSA120T00021671001.1